MSEGEAKKCSEENSHRSSFSDDEQDDVFVAKKNKITKKEKLAMMNLNVALASKYNNSNSKVLSVNKAKIPSITKGTKALNKIKNTTNSPNNAVTTEKTTCKSERNSDSVDDTINSVVKSSCSPNEKKQCVKLSKTKPPATSAHSGTEKKVVQSKSSKIKILSSPPLKRGDSIDETIESVLNASSASCENSSATLNASVKKHPVKSSKCPASNTVTSSTVLSENVPCKARVIEKVCVSYEEDIVDGFAIQSFLTYSDLQDSEATPSTNCNSPSDNKAITSPPPQPNSDQTIGSCIVEASAIKAPLSPPRISPLPLNDQEPTLNESMPNTTNQDKDQGQDSGTESMIDVISEPSETPVKRASPPTESLKDDRVSTVTPPLVVTPLTSCPATSNDSVPSLNSKSLTLQADSKSHAVPCKSMSPEPASCTMTTSVKSSTTTSPHVLAGSFKPETSGCAVTTSVNSTHVTPHYRLDAFKPETPNCAMRMPVSSSSITSQYRPEAFKPFVHLDTHHRNEKKGKWNAMHVRIAWLHQQKTPSTESNSSQLQSSYFKGSNSDVPLATRPSTSSIPTSAPSKMPSSHGSSVLHPFSTSRASELPFTSSLLSAAAGHANNANSSTTPVYSTPGPSPMDHLSSGPFGSLASLSPYSRSPFGSFGNPFLSGMNPGLSSSLSGLHPAAPRTPMSSSLMDPWMRPLPGIPRPSSSSLLPALSAPHVISPTSSASGPSGSAWGGLRAEADRTDVRGGNGSLGSSTGTTADYLSPLHAHYSSLDKRKEESKSSKSHSKPHIKSSSSSSSSSFESSHNSHESPSKHLHSKRANSAIDPSHRNGDLNHHSSDYKKNWDVNKNNKREKSPSSHNMHPSPKFLKYNETISHQPPFSSHSVNSHLAMMSSMSGSSAYGMNHIGGGSNSHDLKPPHHQTDRPKNRPEDDLRRPLSMNDRPRSSSSTNDHLSNPFSHEKKTSSYREALEMELNKNAMLGFPTNHSLPSPYASSSALAAMSMNSPLAERSRFFGLHGSSTFMHPATAAALSSGYPMDPLKSLWGPNPSPYFPSGMGLHPHLDPFKSLHELPSRMSDLMDREHILARYNILNSHGGGAPLTDKLKDSGPSGSSSMPSLSAAGPSCDSAPSMLDKLGSLGLPPPNPSGLLPPFPVPSGLLRPPNLPPLIAPPPPMLGLPVPGSSSSSSLAPSNISL